MSHAIFDICVAPLNPGWYRVPSAASRTGSYVKIITYAGLITLDAAEMTFSQTVGTVFTEAGFDVTGSGRRLLGGGLGRVGRSRADPSQIQ